MSRYTNVKMVGGKGRYSNTAPRFPFGICPVPSVYRDFDPDFLTQCAHWRGRIRAPAHITPFFATSARFSRAFRGGAYNYQGGRVAPSQIN